VPWVSKARLAAVEQAEKQLNALVDAMDDTARLVSIENTGRVLRFGFIRNGTLHTIETYSAMDSTPEAWRRELLQ
jgi:hypothetical protein